MDMSEAEWLDARAASWRRKAVCGLAVRRARTRILATTHPESQISKSVADAREVRLLGLQLAAEQNHADAQFNLGIYYYTGTGVEKDDAKAARLYGRAAEQGHAMARYYLSNCYAHGEGVEKDDAKAAQLLAQAAKQGLAGAQCSLGSCFYMGKGVEKYEVKAA
jgi:TPR repeat protein